MTTDRDIDLINDLIAHSSETTWIEFKRNNADPKNIGKYCSAMSNVARLEGKPCAYMVWGVDNDTRNIVGTDFDPASAEHNGQVLELWLAQRFKPDLYVAFKTIDHPDGRVVLLTIPAAIKAPTLFDGIGYIRIGSTTPKLSDYPNRMTALIDALRPYAWESGIAKQYVSSDEVLNLLDYPSYFTLTQQNLPDRNVIFDHLEADRLIEKDVGGKWNITNLGAILFAKDLNEFPSNLSRKAVRFTAYEGRSRATTVTHRVDGRRGYASGFNNLMDYIHNLLPKNEVIGQALREPRPLYPDIAIRELVANALIHQDMTISGTGPQIELFEDRIEFTNPGEPLMPAERMIDLPPRSRNEDLASLMRRMGMCEEQGSGLDKVITAVEAFQLPAPLFRDKIKNSMQVILYAPRTFAQMTPDERVRACYQHAVLKVVIGDNMRNETLRERFGIEKKNASQVSSVIKQSLEDELIKPADPERPRSGYVPFWA